MVGVVAMWLAQGVTSCHADGTMAPQFGEFSVEGQCWWL
jgi:hypothetical protein